MFVSSTCPQGQTACPGTESCVSDPSTCPPPQNMWKFPYLVGIRWNLLQAQLASDTLELDVLIAEAAQCYKKWDDDPSTNPMRLENYEFGSWDDSHFEFCFPLTRGVTIAFPEWTLSFEEFLLDVCGPSSCTCPGFRQATDGAASIFINFLLVFQYLMEVCFDFTGIPQVFRALLYREQVEGLQEQALLCVITDGMGSFFLVLALAIVTYFVMDTLGVWVAFVVASLIEAFYFTFVMLRIARQMDHRPRRDALASLLHGLSKIKQPARPEMLPG